MYKPRQKKSSLKNNCLVGLLLTFCFCSTVFSAESPASTRLAGAVICRTELNPSRREELAGKLRKISGWPNLKFDAEGILRQGPGEPVGGSRSARDLLGKAMLGTNAVVLEDVSRRADVAFMRVIPGHWKNKHGPPAFVVQIDFVDFDHVIGDDQALEAFNIGWGLLHELDHIANNSGDANSFGETGECEMRINQMRLECNLPQRIDYFYTLSPLTRDTTFATKLVRLAFDQQQSGSAKRKRYWIVWDANLVGGLDLQKAVAELR